MSAALHPGSSLHRSLPPSLSHPVAHSLSQERIPLCRSPSAHCLSLSSVLPFAPRVSDETATSDKPLLLLYLRPAFADSKCETDCVLLTQDLFRMREESLFIDEIYRLSSEVDGKSYHSLRDTRTHPHTQAGESFEGRRGIDGREKMQPRELSCKGGTQGERCTRKDKRSRETRKSGAASGIYMRHLLGCKRRDGAFFPRLLPSSSLLFFFPLLPRVTLSSTGGSSAR